MAVATKGSSRNLKEILLPEKNKVYKQSLKTCLKADAFKSLAESKEVYKQSLKTCLKADVFKSLAESKEVY